MKLIDHLSKEQILQLNKFKAQSPKNKQQKKKGKQEKINWAEIMGMSRQTHYKKNGAWRGK
ncbi:hypothetical protein BIV60_13885 [Bacillus sp. MUM 116]|uniref:hypothetical protein n=1 Tax=Bacillus sp. MUM 116 TaxID=1678002 RepID=UPI0008F5C242|nr:hypothetical protein [Bacillus sp. MUM 116]OIK13580.1 hypothetical protein BIV60_13885 [Bacillus sp. MUM 116]